MSDPRRPAADRSTSVDYVALSMGRRVGRYEIVSVLGHGSFGITYRARDTQLGREVAVKEYLPAACAVRQDGSAVLPRSTEVADDFGWGRSRFVEEGRTLANLHETPSIVRVFDFLEANGTAYIVMELLRGRTLEERVRSEGPLVPAALEAILWPLLSGLQKVHEAGFLHRDIKPANIVLGVDGRATLIDFGASRAAMADRTKTMTAIFTPGYAAPEQFTSARQGPWTDIYGLAATLHYAVTGRAPPNAVDRLMDDTYEPLAARRPGDLSRSLALGIDAALALAANQRPQNVAAWRTVLWQQPPGDPTVVMEKVPTATRPFPAGRWLVIAAGLALLGAGGYYLAVAPPLETPSTNEGTPQLAERGIDDTPRKEEPAVASLKVEVERREAEAQARRTAAAQLQVKREAEEKARLEGEEKARRDEEARLRSAQPPGNPLDGHYGGSFNETAMGQTRMVSVSLQLSGTSLAGQLLYQRCGTVLVSLMVAPSGEISGSVRLPDAMACIPIAGTASGQVTKQGLRLELNGPGIAARATLARGGQASAASMAPVPPAAVPAPASPPAVATSTFDGAYAGSLSSSASSVGPAALRPIAADLRVSRGRLTGQLVHPTCGATSMSLAVDAAGVISGTTRLPEPVGCSMSDAAASGKVSADALTLDIRSVAARARGSLAKRPE